MLCGDSHGEEHNMANLLLLLAVVLAGASVLFTNTVTAALGYPGWISNTCDSMPFLCNNPQQLAIAAAAFGALWIIAKLLSALRG
jgi:hypothetical protein